MAATYYAIHAGGNWSAGASWSTISTKDVTRVGGATQPTAVDTCILDDYSGAVTVDTTTCVCLTVNCATNGNYGSALTFTSAKILTVSGDIVFSSAAGFSTSGTGTLQVNAASNMTSQGKTLTATLQFASSPTITFVDNWTVGALRNPNAGSNAVMNQTDGTHGNQITVSGNFFNNSGMSGTTTIILGGTGTWSGGGSASTIANNLTINTSGTITISGTIYYKTGTLTYTAGTISLTNTPLLTLSNTPTLNTSGMTWGSVTLGTSTYTLTSDFNCSGTLITNSATITGAHDISCGTLLVGGASTFTYPAGQYLTVTTAIQINSSSANTTTLQSGTATSPAYLSYQGTPANQKVWAATFIDIDASDSSDVSLGIPEIIYNYQGGTLTRTINIINVTSADMRQEGCLGAGSVATNTAQARSGTCVALTPSSTTDPYYWIFLFPTTASSALKLNFYHRITSGFNGSMVYTIYDTDNITELDYNSVIFTDDGAYHLFQSASVTPTDTGFCRVVLKMLKGTGGTAIYIDDVSAS